ncbi:hypothetical protein L917_01324 [Phytophthora nicotianae]|uniref:Uncharacterized protein n=1 Tax=Phytophthora nicotianae TaxID=4792 RepID=W2LZT8_PHYNI|nr:hypothetical protein L917_01324 [Phytophthora nicotianae]
MGAAVNDFTDRCNFPDVSYNPPKDIARRIWELRIRFPGHPLLMMIGDVSGAFRHIPTNADHMHMFAFQFDDFIVIDLSCGFDWCGSPAFYSVSGSPFNALYESQHPPANLAPIDSTSPRCMQADIALRKAMTTVFGPRARKEDKFTQWSTKIKALGLLWNTENGAVSVMGSLRAHYFGLHVSARV